MEVNRIDPEGCTRLILLLIMLAAVLICDIRTGKIKNSVLLSIIVSGLVLNAVTYGILGFVISVCGFLSPVAMLFLLYYLGMMGAGDVKMFGAIGVLMGARTAICSIPVSFVFGGVIGIIILLLRRNGRERVGTLLLYMKCCILSHRLLIYEAPAGSGRNGSFRFSMAAVPGTVAAVLILMLGGGLP